MNRLLYAGRLLRVSRTSKWTTPFGSQSSFEPKKTFSLSSAMAAPTVEDPSDDADESAKKTPLEFSDKAYRDRPSGELLRAYMVYKMFAFEFLVNRGDQLIRWSRKIFGRWLFQKMMRATAYGQFVAGENLDELRPVMDRMRRKGIRSILDYAVEEDVDSTTMVPEVKEDEDNKKKVGSNNISAREYFYEGHEKCEQNKQKFMECIDVAAKASEEEDCAFAAIKVTALGNTQILKQQTREIRVMLWLFKELADQPSFVDGTLTPASLHTGLNKHLAVSESQVDSMFQEMDTNGLGKQDFFQWQDSLQPQTQLYDFLSKHAEQIGMPGYLCPQNSQGRGEWRDIELRAEELAHHAQTRKVRLLVDAEQTYFQLAIRDIAVNYLMPKYNKKTAIIYNTQQCYLKNVEEMVQLDLLTAHRMGFIYAAKLVRGAYMEQERTRAKNKGYVDPVCNTKEDTDKQYHQMLDKLLMAICGSSMKYEMMVASHNEESVRKAVKLMDQKGIAKDSGSVAFGQLLGMCDHVSLTLGKAGYHIYKYMPYGPVEEVLPYLLRRANENKGILKGAVRERKLLVAELKRRLLPTFLHK